MTDDQQHPTRCHGLRGATQDSLAWQVDGGVQEARGDQVVFDGWIPLTEVGGDPGDGIAGLLGCRTDGQRGRGDVDRRDSPAVARQPESVPALTAAEVECGAGGDSSHFTLECCIDLAAP